MHVLSQLLPSLSVSRETTDRLEHFAILFEKWSKSINLVAPSTRESLWERHIADSAQLRLIAPQPKQWIDIGSGGGFPGVITAILLAETGDGWVHLVESNHKKAGFLRIALSETGARGSVHPVRIEDAAQTVPAGDAISARALADLDKLCGLIEPWLQGTGTTRGYFHKGRDYREEIAKARGRWDFDLVIHESAIEADSVILEIGGLSRRF